MKQLGELQKNGAQQFRELGVEVVAVFREEREGIAGLKKIKNRTKVDFTLALDTPANATKAYSNGRKEFDNYLVDGTGVIRGVIDGSVKTRAQSEQLVKMIKSLSDSGGSGSVESMDDTASVQKAVMDYVHGIYLAKTDLIQRSVHPDLKMYKGVAGKSGQTVTYAQLVDFASKYKAGSTPKDAMKEVKVFEVSGNLASARLKSSWGTDMLHLVKEDGQWKIMQIVSQTMSK